uniref:Transposase Tc1-like domain-containing protein n=1 Tax=Oncorhynchus tshawytscha TaxID=74940 RepID=A0AAZ3P0J9_ONCTS
MGPRSRHTAQEGDAFCLLEMNVLWCEKCKSIPEQQQRTLLEETGTKVSISTVKQVLYRHNLKGSSARKKKLLQNRHKKSQVTVCNCTWGQRSYFLEKCPLV